MGYLCVVGDSRRPVCQYNEDCPPDKLCDRLNRVCINPCAEDSCGDNAECVPTNHGISCSCLPGHQGNAYIECEQGKRNFTNRSKALTVLKFLVSFVLPFFFLIS